MLQLRKVTTVLAAVVVAAIAFASPAHAQATRTWVSGNGNDANPCSYTAPCKTFAGAISHTAAGGEIDALDPGGYGTVTITKSITIDGGGGVVASILASGANGINIAGSGIVVTLRNLNFNGAGSGLAGVSFTNGAQLHVLNCEIQSNNQFGLIFQPSVAGARLFVQNSTIHNNPGYGMVVGPTSASGTSTRVTLDGVKLFGNGIGMRVTDNTLMTVTRSTIANNSFDGVVLASAVAGTIVSFEETAISSNGGNGISAAATGAGHSIARISNDYISGNAGSSMSIGVGGDVISFGTNRITDNGTNTSPSGTLLQQ